MNRTRILCSLSLAILAACGSDPIDAPYDVSDTSEADADSGDGATDADTSGPDAEVDPDTSDADTSDSDVVDADVDADMDATDADTTDSEIDPDSSDAEADGDTSEVDADAEEVDQCTLRAPTSYWPQIEVGTAHVSEFGFDQSDFAFDRAGHLVTVDADGNVVRISADGSREIWVRDVVARAGGVAYLASGELLVTDVITGRLVKVYPTGDVRTFVSNLDHPIGLEVDVDGGIYVSESNSGGITRIDPVSGGQRSILLGLPFQPGAITFSDNYSELYIAARGRGEIYVITRGADRVWSGISRFSGLPGTEAPCDDEDTGSLCEIGGVVGECTEDGAGGTYCRPFGICERAEPGDPCTEFGQAGVCTDNGDSLYCEPRTACWGLEAGDPCLDFGTAGTCTADGGGGLYCRPVSVCDSLELGDACFEFGTSGVCLDDGAGSKYCGVPPACAGLEIGAPCREFDADGVCTDDGFGNVYCYVPVPCEGAAEGDTCGDFGDPRECVEGPFGGLVCVDLDCLGGESGLRCFVDGRPGTCEFDRQGILDCWPASPCSDGIRGMTCTSESGAPGTCAEQDAGELYCQTSSTCGDSLVGEDCFDPTSAVSGTCTVNLAEGTYCAKVNPCDTADLGADCVDPISSEFGICNFGANAFLWCQPAGVCGGLNAGDSCVTPWGSAGECVFDGFALTCQEVFDACAGLSAGMRCSLATGDYGTCVDDGRTGLVCTSEQPCNGLEAGADCRTPGGISGECTDLDGTLVCTAGPACVDAAEGDNCFSSTARAGGTCQGSRGGLLACVPNSPCASSTAGDACTSHGLNGACEAAADGELWCNPNTSGGSITAMTTDGCGNLYIADDLSRTIWRFSSGGTNREIIATVPQGPISAMGWSGNSRGWDNSRLYLTAGGGTEVLSLDPQVASRTVVMPNRIDTAPTSPEPTPVVDCANISPEPLEINEMGAARAYHDIAFDTEGYLIGTDNSNLLAVTRDDQVQLYASGLSGIQGLAWLQDGTLAVATGLGIAGVAANGSVFTIEPNISAYGLIVGPDGYIYASDNSVIHRIDPSTGASQVYLNPNDFGESWGARNVDFDPDHDLMYIGTFGESIYVMTIDENFNPVGRPRHFATVRSSVNYQDGLGIDFCGNIYVPNYESSAFYRITQDGVVHLYKQWDFQQYGHGVEWGRGFGGWRTDAVYLPQPYDGNTVVEVVTGVPARP